ncbi:nucleopolyhedrovirus P10 family protein [Streptomyces sp. NPDC002888]|uniref:nucleopolyhedrovirus P10 family protein n=1 Tax=Streptomyces sp. NPDC002888 TaxID=3364668 RepID=UPI0036767021
MTADGWTQTVRQQLGLGRLLPLGGLHDGAWIAEGAAEAVLRQGVRELRGVRLGPLRIASADPEGTYEAAVPPPPSALPPGPLRVTADFAAAAPSEPLPTVASRLRAALATAAAQRLGLTVTEIDLRVTALLDALSEPEPVRPPEPPEARPGTAPDESRAATVALAVPGVTRLTGTLGGLGRAIHFEEHTDDTTALPRRHARVEIAVQADHRALDVARAVRTAVWESLHDHPTVAVLVTTVE